MSSSLYDLRGALDRVLTEIGETQGSIGVSRDRNDGARGALAIAVETSSRDEAAGALASMARADDLLEQTLAAMQQAREQIELFMGSL